MSGPVHWQKTRLPHWLQAVLLLTTLFVGACHSSDGVAGPIHTLNVFLTAGVAGAPAGGSQTAAESKSISYSFSAKSGYKNLRVMIDGVPASTSGSIQMTQDHLLYAEADSIIVPTASQQQAITQTRTVLTSTDIVSAFKGLVQTEYALDRSTTASSAAAQRNTVTSLAFDQKADAAGLVKVDAALNGNYFDLDFPAPSIIGNAKVQAAATALPISFIFVNGINNSYDDALSGAITTKRLIEEIGLPAYGWPQYSTRLFYVASTDARAAGSTFCVLASSGSATTLALPFLSFVEFVNGICGIVLDLAQSAIDVANLLRTQPSTALSQKLADGIREERNKGRGVILIGHSRGTLVSQLALKSYLGAAEGNFAADQQKCVGFLSLAGPSPSQVALRNVRNLFVKGALTEDILLPLARVIDPSTPGYRTNLSDRTDADYPIVKSVIKEKSAQFRAGIILHNVVDSYLLDPISRDSVQRALQREVAALQSECAPAVTSLSLSASPSEGISGVGLNPQPVVILRDKDGARVGTASQIVTVSLSGSGGTLGGTLSVAAENGAATFKNLAITGSGSFRLVFSSPGLSSITSGSFTIIPASCAGSPVTFPFAVNGTISTSSCLVNSRRAQTYRFDVPGNGARQLTINAGFSPFVKVSEAGGQGNYTVWTSGTTLNLRWLLASGSYILGAGSHFGALGSYTLSGTVAPENPGTCVTTYVLQPALLESQQSLTASDCTESGKPYDEYSFGGSGSCTTTITANGFNPVLEIIDHSGGRVAIANAGSSNSVRLSLAQCYVGTDGEFLFGLHAQVSANQLLQTGAYRISIQFGSGSAVLGEEGKPILLGRSK